MPISVFPQTLFFAIVNATLRGEVIGRDHKQCKLVIHMKDSGGVVQIDRAADLLIEEGCAVDIHEDSSFLHPVASTSTEASREELGAKTMRMMSTEEVIKVIVDEREASEKISWAECK